MGTRQIRYCDKCEKVIEGRLTLKTCPCCGREVCIVCFEKANPVEKPRRTENALTIPVDNPSLMSDGLKIHTPQEEGEDYIVSIKGKESHADTLRKAVQQTLCEYGDEIPDFLDADRKTLEGILGD